MTLTDGKEVRCSIELCDTLFSLHYFKPSSFKNMNPNVVSEIKLIAHELCSIYTIDNKSVLFSDSSIDYVKREMLKMLELSRESGCRVLILNAPFNALGVFVFGKKFSIVNSFFGGKSDGFYAIAFAEIQKLAKEVEKELAEGIRKNDRLQKINGKEYKRRRILQRM